MVDTRRGPDARRRGQAADGLVADEDHARAEKAHARHDLRGDTGRIQRHALEGGHVGKAVFGNNHDERRRQCHDQVRADSGLFQTVVAFVTDEAAAYPGDEDAKKEFQLCKDGDVHEPPRLLESTIIVICQLWCGSSCCSRQVPKGDMGSGERRFGRGSNTGKAYGFLPDRLQRYKALTAIPRRRCNIPVCLTASNGVRPCRKKPYGPSAKKSSPRGRALCVSGVGTRITRRGSRR